MFIVVGKGWPVRELEKWRTIMPLAEIVNNIEEAIMSEWNSASASAQVNESIHENERMH